MSSSATNDNLTGADIGLMEKSLRIWLPEGNKIEVTSMDKLPQTVEDERRKAVWEAIRALNTSLQLEELELTLTEDLGTLRSEDGAGAMFAIKEKQEQLVTAKTARKLAVTRTLLSLNWIARIPVQQYRFAYVSKNAGKLVSAH